MNQSSIIRPKFFAWHTLNIPMAYPEYSNEISRIFASKIEGFPWRRGKVDHDVRKEVINHSRSLCVTNISDVNLVTRALLPSFDRNRLTHPTYFYVTRPSNDFYNAHTPCVLKVNTRVWSSSRTRCIYFPSLLICRWSGWTWNLDPGGYQYRNDNLFSNDPSLVCAAFRHHTESILKEKHLRLRYYTN